MAVLPHRSLVIWREWSDETFAQAKREDKPILLDIGAVWCHWCHVMDDGIPGDPIHTGTYSNSEIAEFINSNYIPIKVDNDKRPDINARYNMGGWPTTAFLTPNGDTLYGETYVYPQRMMQLLPQIAEYYQKNRDDIAERIAAHLAESDNIPLVNTELSEIASTELPWIDQELIKAFDAHYAGFGSQPKFPHVEALEYALLRCVQTQNKDLRDIYKETMEAMAAGGMYDQFAGGFFRYSTTRDWSIPHYEKMLEDNARLSRLAFLGARLLGEDKLADIGRDVHNWLLTTMFDIEKSVFAGSQDADKEDEYYGRPLSEREHLPTPFIDRTAYINWNAMMVSSLCERYRSDLDAEKLNNASRCYRFLKDKIYPKHYFDQNGAGGSEYLLADLTALATAALDLAEAEGGATYLSDATQIAEYILANLDDTIQGGYFDMRPDATALGSLASPVKDLASSSACASLMLCLHTIESNTRYLESAKRALTFCSLSSRRSGLFASAFGLSLMNLNSAGKIVVVGEIRSALVQGFQQAVWQQSSTPGFELIVLAPGDDNEFPTGPNGCARAYVCVGTLCNAFDTLIELTNFIAIKHTAA